MKDKGDLISEALEFIYNEGGESKNVEMRPFFKKNIESDNLREYQRRAKRIIRSLEEGELIKSDNNETLSFGEVVIPYYRKIGIDDVNCIVSLRINGVFKAIELLKEKNEKLKLTNKILSVISLIASIIAILGFLGIATLDKALEMLHKSTEMQDEKQILEEIESDSLYTLPLFSDTTAIETTKFLIE